VPEEVNLTPEQKAALAALSHGQGPDAGLEDRVVAELRERGLLRRRQPAFRWQMVGAAAAAAILLFIGGFFAGRESVVKTKTVNDLANVQVEGAGKGVTQVVWF
jgi:hypothetical protein